MAKHTLSATSHTPKKKNFNVTTYRFTAVRNIFYPLQTICFQHFKLKQIKKALVLKKSAYICTLIQTVKKFMQNKTIYEGDTSLIESLLNGYNFLSGISPKEYSYIYDVRLTFEVKQKTGYVSYSSITIKNISGGTINYICSLTGSKLHLELLQYAPYTYPYEPNNPIGFDIQKITEVEKTLVSIPSTSHSNSSQSKDSSNSSSGEDLTELIGGSIMLIIAVCVFIFYAKEEFGVLLGILYSLFWFISIPIHYFFF